MEDFYDSRISHQDIKLLHLRPDWKGIDYIIIISTRDLNTTGYPLERPIFIMLKSTAISSSFFNAFIMHNNYSLLSIKNKFYFEIWEGFFISVLMES